MCLICYVIVFFKFSFLINLILVVFYGHFFYSKAITIFEEDERFKAVERAKDRENLYEDYLVELGNKVGICNSYDV